MAYQRANVHSFFMDCLEKLDSIISGVGGTSSKVLTKEQNGTGNATITATGTIITINNRGAADLTFQPDSCATPITVFSGEILNDIPFSSFTEIDIVASDKWQVVVVG